MKSTKLVVLLSLAAAISQAQAPQAPQAPQPPKNKGTVGFGSTPTQADIYCAGYISAEHVPETRFVAAGGQSPDQSRYSAQHEFIFIRGKDMKEGDRFVILRHAVDPNHYESYKGQKAAVKDLGEPYFERGYVRVIDVQKEIAIAVP